MAKTAEPISAAPTLGSPAMRGSVRMGDTDVFDTDRRDAVATRRNPLMVGGGLLLAAIAMLAGALLFNARGERRAVVVSAVEIPAGTVIQADMLRIEHIEADARLRSLPGPQFGLLVGKAARERIPAGVLVVEEQVTAALQPPAGFSLVAMTLEAGELPVASLSYGDNVDVVRTPQSGSPDDPGGVISTAAVWSMWQQSAQAVAASGTKRAVTLAVPEADAVAVAQAAARREVRLIAVGGDPVFSPRIGELGAAFPAGAAASTPGAVPSSVPVSSKPPVASLAPAVPATTVAPAVVVPAPTSVPPVAPASPVVVPAGQ